jgi:hypothetical protein
MIMYVGEAYLIFRDGPRLGESQLSAVRLGLDGLGAVTILLCIGASLRLL